MKPKRFVLWKRSINELEGDCIATLEHKIQQAKAIVANEESDEVLILEIKKVVRVARAPVIVKDY